MGDAKLQQLLQGLNMPGMPGCQVMTPEKMMGTGGLGGLGGLGGMGDFGAKARMTEDQMRQMARAMASAPSAGTTPSTPPSRPPPPSSLGESSASTDIPRPDKPVSFAPP